MSKSKDYHLEGTEMKSMSEKVDDEKNVEVSDEKIELKKELGLLGGISFIVGSIIGSGIFVSPKGVLDATGSIGLSLMVWVGAGLIGLIGALCYAELGTFMVRSGGEYTYIRKGYGDFPGFLCIWVSTVLIRPSSLAVLSLTFGTYFMALFDTCGEPETLAKLAGIVCLLSVMLLNCYSVKWTALIQIITTVAKTLALFVIIIGGIYKMAQGNTDVLSTGFSGSTSNPTVIALAFYDALWAYDGWNNLTAMTEELRNPKKNLPRANIFSMIFVIVIYALTNICYLTVMTKQELLDADAVAVLWGDRVLGAAASIIPLAVMISTFGSLNGTAFSGGRTVFAAARDGNLPEVLAFVNVQRHTPLPSMIFTVLTAIIFVMIGDISSLVDFFSFTAWLFYGLTISTLILFRFRYKDAPRPYKVPIILPILMVLIAIYLIIAPIVESPSLGYLYAILFILGGTFLYFPLIHFKLKVPYFDQITMYLQLILEISPTTKQD